MSVDIVTQLRSPEKVLHSISTAARLEGMPAPRRISFDEPTPIAPLPILSLTWLALADMTPWLPFFHADSVRPYTRADGAVHHAAYAVYCGWQLSLNAVETCACNAEPVHQLGCPAEPVITGTPAEVLAHLTDHFGRAANHDEALRLAAEHHTVTIADVVALPRDEACSFCGGTTTNHLPGCSFYLPRRTPGSRLDAVTPYGDDHRELAEALLAEVSGE